MTRPELTWRQRKILQVIRESVQEHGYPPSLREIADAAGLASPGSVSYQLGVLQRKGYLCRDSRTIRLVRLPADDTAPGEPRLAAGLIASLMARRIELGLSQEAVARRMQATQGMVWRLETGRYDIRLSTLQRYADALGVSLTFQARDRNRLGALTPERPCTSAGQ